MLLHERSRRGFDVRLHPDGRGARYESVQHGDLRQTSPVLDHVAHEGRYPDAVESTQAMDAVDLVQTDLARVEHGEVNAVDVAQNVYRTWVHWNT